LGERRRTAEALFFLGRERFFLPQEAETAADDFRRSAALWREEPDPAAKDWQAQALNSAGVLLKTLGRPNEARKLYDEAAAISGGLADATNQATSLSNLGSLALEQDDTQRGVALLIEAARKAHEGGDRATEAGILNNLGSA